MSRFAEGGRLTSQAGGTPEALPPMPAAEANGFVCTLNKMGYMTSWLDPTSQAFVDFAAAAPGPVLDVGAAYGIASLAALQRGAEVIANDIEPMHLHILRERVPQAWRARLTLLQGEVPEGVRLAPQSLGAVLASRVLHFFDGPRIERTAAMLFHWLAAGGKAFLVNDTPFMNNYQHVVPVYEQRRADGDPWPGYMPSLRAPRPERAANLPRAFHFLDCEVMRRVFVAAGFEVEHCAMFARLDYPDDLRHDGREGVGLIVRKPPAALKT